MLHTNPKNKTFFVTNFIWNISANSLRELLNVQLCKQKKKKKEFRIPKKKQGRNKFTKFEFRILCVLNLKLENWMNGYGFTKS